MSQVPDLGPDFRVLQRVPLTAQFATLEGDKWTVGDEGIEAQDYILAIVDFETTGLNKAFDEVLEFGVVMLGIKDGFPRILGVGNWLNQPSQPITQEITDITGITDAMVAGKALPVDHINRIMAYADGIAAHNADFDRAFYDRYFGYADVPWFCTSKGGDIDWKALGQKSAGLENLLTAHGYFYDAHRAVIDCIATAHLLTIRKDAMEMMFERGNKTSFRIKAIGAPFDVKDHLKEANYRWNSELKHWWIQVIGEDEKAKQLAFLDTLYRNASRYASVQEILPIDKYRSSK